MLSVVTAAGSPLASILSIATFERQWEIIQFRLHPCISCQRDDFKTNLQTGKQQIYLTGLMYIRAVSAT